MLFSAVFLIVNTRDGSGSATFREPEKKLSKNNESGFDAQPPQADQRPSKGQKTASRGPAKSQERAGERRARASKRPETGQRTARAPAPAPCP
jgi:hypothetical protein